MEFIKEMNAWAFTAVDEKFTPAGMAGYSAGRRYGCTSSHDYVVMTPYARECQEHIAMSIEGDRTTFEHVNNDVRMKKSTPCADVQRLEAVLAGGSVKYRRYAFVPGGISFFGIYPALVRRRYFSAGNVAKYKKAFAKEYKHIDASKIDAAFEAWAMRGKVPMLREEYFVMYRVYKGRGVHRNNEYYRYCPVMQFDSIEEAKNYNVSNIDFDTDAVLEEMNEEFFEALAHFNNIGNVKEGIAAYINGAGSDQLKELVSRFSHLDTKGFIKNLKRWSHPDAGGSHSLFIEATNAIDRFF